MYFSCSVVHYKVIKNYLILVAKLDFQKTVTFDACSNKLVKKIEQKWISRPEKTLTFPNNWNFNQGINLLLLYPHVLLWQDAKTDIWEDMSLKVY